MNDFLTELRALLVKYDAEINATYDKYDDDIAVTCYTNVARGRDCEWRDFPDMLSPTTIDTTPQQ